MRHRRRLALWLCPELKDELKYLNETNARLAVRALTAASTGGRGGVLEILTLNTQLVERIMHTLDDVLAVVAAQKTKIDSLVALTQALHQKVKDALGSTATPSMQMRIDQVFQAVQDNADEVQQAIDANTDAPPADTPPASSGSTGTGTSAPVADPTSTSSPPASSTGSTGSSSTSDASAGAPAATPTSAPATPAS